MTLVNGTLEKAADAINPPALSQDNDLTFVDLFAASAVSTLPPAA